MPDFDFEHALGSETAMPHLGELVMRVGLAALLGAFVAFRPWRRFLGATRPPSAQAAQSQTLIAASGALMVIVIGESIARAFGLVGLGSFIRFRSGIRDPRDAAVLFVMIGIGMACGLGLFAMATASTTFVALLLTVFDYGARRQTKPTLISIQAEDASNLQQKIREVFPEARMVEIASNAPELGKEDRKSTRLNSSHSSISYAVFCLKKKTTQQVINGLRPADAGGWCITVGAAG